MKKDRLSMGSATLSLMAVAVLYKLILVLIGLGILLFGKKACPRIWDLIWPFITSVFF